MILPLNKNVDNKNLICVMKLGEEHGQMKFFFFFLAFFSSKLGAYGVALGFVEWRG